MDFDMIDIEQWCLAQLGVPAKERKKRLAEAVEHRLKELAKNIEVMKLLRTKGKISFDCRPVDFACEPLVVGARRP